MSAMHMPRKILIEINHAILLYLRQLAPNQKGGLQLAMEAVANLLPLRAQFSYSIARPNAWKGNLTASAVSG
jgi:hypothetical protein